MRNKFCIISYILSILIMTILSFKLINVRSKCIRERARLSKLIDKIETLKRENNDLSIVFYKDLNPQKVDNNTQDMLLLHENEVKYIK